MSTRFNVIRLHGHPTREDAITTMREIGEAFLSQHVAVDSYRYCGYIIQDGQLSPFWRMTRIPERLISQLPAINSPGYAGKLVLEQDHN